MSRTASAIAEHQLLVTNVKRQRRLQATALGAAVVPPIPSAAAPDTASLASKEAEGGVSPLWAPVHPPLAAPADAPGATTLRRGPESPSRESLSGGGNTWHEGRGSHRNSALSSGPPSCAALVAPGQEGGVRHRGAAGAPDARADGGGRAAAGDGAEAEEEAGRAPQNGVAWQAAAGQSHEAGRGLAGRGSEGAVEEAKELSSALTDTRGVAAKQEGEGGRGGGGAPAAGVALREKQQQQQPGSVVLGPSDVEALVNQFGARTLVALLQEVGRAAMQPPPPGLAPPSSCPSPPPPSALPPLPWHLITARLCQRGVLLPSPALPALLWRYLAAGLPFSSHAPHKPAQPLLPGQAPRHGAQQQAAGGDWEPVEDWWAGLGGPEERPGDAPRHEGLAGATPPPAAGDAQTAPAAAESAAALAQAQRWAQAQLQAWGAAQGRGAAAATNGV